MSFSGATASGNSAGAQNSHRAHAETCNNDFSGYSSQSVAPRLFLSISAKKIAAAMIKLDPSDPIFRILEAIIEPTGEFRDLVEAAKLYQKQTFATLAWLVFH